jgi:hypothetical protein
MSLDIKLKTEKLLKKKKLSQIFIRENGKIKEISEEEWNKRNLLRRQPVKFFSDEEETNEVYSDNITHNLGKMAAEAGIYTHLWKPDSINIIKAKDLINPLTDGLTLLKSDADKFKKLNPPNGWGNYEVFVEFVENYLKACINNPETTIEVSR